MDRKEEIIIRAAEIIRDEGYDRLTLSSLAAKMNMQKASLYYYFDSKDDLMDSIYTYFEEDCLHLGFSVDFSLNGTLTLEKHLLGQEEKLFYFPHRAEKGNR